MNHSECQKVRRALDLMGPQPWHDDGSPDGVCDFSPQDKAKFTDAQRFLSETWWTYKYADDRTRLATSFLKSVRPLFAHAQDGQDRYEDLAAEMKRIARIPNEEAADRWEECQNLVYVFGELGRAVTPRRQRPH